MSLKEYFENHPLTILIGISAAVATTTAGMVQSFSDKVHKAELIQISTEHTVAISGLQTRLVSIERRIGNGEAFFDVSRLLLPPTSVRSLGDNYKTIGNGDFFVAEPSMEGWSYDLTSEIALIKDSIVFNEDAASIFDMFPPVLEKKNLHLWRNENSIKFKPKLESGEESNGISFNFFPHVGVQVMKVSEFHGLAKQIGEAINASAKTEKILNRISKLLETLDVESKEVGNIDETQSAATNLPGESTDGKTESLKVTEAKMEIESDLSKLFRGDLASIVLAAIAQQIVAMPVQFPGASSSLESVQKKGNVLYIQSALTFPEAQIEGETNSSSLTVHQEFFIATNSENIFFVKVQIPTADGRSNAFAWVSQWLSGIRIPFKAV